MKRTKSALYYLGIKDNGYSRKIKIGVCHSTAFHMRHKLLVYMEELTEQSEPLEALIEADETYKKMLLFLHRLIN